MKTENLFVLCTVLLAFSLFSCNNDNEPDFTNYENEKYVKFVGVIEGTQTKANGTSWGTGDGIGVYMKTAGGSLSANHLADNVKYTTPGDGVFTWATTGIEFPATGSVDFIAYYPYLASQTGYTLAFSVANQSSLPDIDVLYSNNAVNASKTNPSVAMSFRHKLSQLILNVTAGDGVTSLSGLTLSMANAKVAGTLDLEDGTVASTGNASTLTLSPSISGTTASVQAILVPGQDLKDTPLTFTVGGKTYEWVPTTQLLDTGKKYTYSIQLTATGVVVLSPAGTIEDWVDGNPGGGSIVLTPKESDFQANVPTVSLAAAAGSNDVIQLTAPSDQAWTAAATGSWLTISPASGTGSESITLTATANTEATERSATVTITPTGSSSLTAITVVVTQAGSGGAVATEFFRETFGTEAAITTAKVGLYTGYVMSTSGYTFSDPYAATPSAGRSDVRSTSTMSPHVWLAATYDSGLLIEGIAAGYTQMTLSYDVATNSQSGTVDANILIVKCNDVEIAVPSTIMTVSNNYVNITIDIPDGTTKIEFFSDATTNVSGIGLRLDNVVISGAQ